MLGCVWLQRDLSVLHGGNSHVCPLASTIDALSTRCLGAKPPAALQGTSLLRTVGRAWAAGDAADAVSPLFVDPSFASQH